MGAVFQSEGILLTIISAIVAFSIFASQRLPVFKSMGPPVTAALIGIIFVNLKIVPSSAPVYDAITNYTVYVSIVMMLLNVDIKAMMKLSKKPLLAMFLACIAIAVGAMFGGLLLARTVDEGWKLAGMYVGSYTGGSANLTAIGYALKASGNTLAAANAADYAIGMPMVLVLFSMPAFYKKSKWLQKHWPYTLPKEQLEQGDSEDLMGDKSWSILDVAKSIAIALAICEISKYIGSFASESVSEAITVLSITTLSIIAAQFKPVKEIKGSMDLGMFFALYYLVLIGFMVSIPVLLQSAINVALLCFVICGTSFFLHLLLCRLFKIEYEYVVCAIVAAIWDGPTSALVAAGAKWESLIGISVVLGVIGHAVGNYLGIGIAYLLQAIL